MRAIVAVVGVLVLAWCGYWFVGARAVSAGAERALAEARAQGLRAEATDISVLGFPNRFDLTLTAPELADPATGFGWTAPFVQIFAMTWKPWHVIAAFAPEQLIETPAGPATLTAGKLQASLRVRPVPSLPLDRARVIGTDLSLALPGGIRLATPALRFATRDVDGAGVNHEIGLEVTELSAEGSPGGTIDRIRLDAVVSLSAPLDRQTAATPPVLTSLEVKEALAVRGDVSLHVSGRLAPDAAGLAEGSLALRAENWRDLLPALVSAGLVKPEVVPTWTRMLEIVAQQSGDPNVIDLTLTFARGRMMLGPLPVGTAPRLR